MSSAALHLESPARRSRLVAALLSLIAPGVGQLYAGAPRRGLVVFLIFFAVMPAMLAGAFLLPPTFEALAIAAMTLIGALAAVWLFAIIDAARIAGRADPAPRAAWHALLAAVLGVWALTGASYALSPAVKRQLPWRNFSVVSTSMQPTLRIGEQVLGDTTYYASRPPARGDLVFYRLPSDNSTIYIKRVVAIAGDRIAFRDGHVILNGVMTTEPFADFGPANAFLNTTAEVTVPADHFFAAGDNRANSSDSRARQHGMVPLKNLVARATEIFLSDDVERAGLWVGTPGK
jgi:signal peptidase I